MPNRIIREGWLESERINELDASAERFFLRLCLRADDFGRFHANPLLLKSSLFPLRDDTRSTDIPRWIAACEKAGLLRCYEVEGKKFVEIAKFGQRTRAQVSKFPTPPSCDSHLSDIRPSNGSHLSDTGPSGDGHARTESESESEAEAESISSRLKPDGSDQLIVEPSASEPKPPKPPKVTAPDCERFVDWFLGLLESTGGPVPKLSEDERAKWADAYEKLLRLDGHTKDEVKAVCEWARNDSFWRGNFMSPRKLRTKTADGVAYFCFFVNKMRAAASPQSVTGQRDFNKHPLHQ